MKQTFSISKPLENSQIKNETEKENLEKSETSEILESSRNNETTIVKISAKPKKFTRTNGPMVDLSDLFRSRKVEENEEENSPSNRTEEKHSKRTKFLTFKFGARTRTLKLGKQKMRNP